MLRRMRLQRASTECLLAGAPALLIFIWWVTREGGYFERSWMPGAVLILAIGAASAIALRADLALPSRTAKVAVAAFGAYVAWSFLSILWAGNPGDALEGSQRALLYLACFALFVLLPWTPRTVLFALVGFIATMTVVGVVTAIRLVGDAPLDELFIDARLRAPVGYHNAAAALWTMAAVPALVLAARSELPIWLRPLLLASATLLLGLAVLSQSRGWLYTLPLVLLAALLLSPDRLKLLPFAVFGLAEVAIAARDLIAVNSAGAGLDPGAVDGAVRPVLDGAMTTLATATAGAFVAGLALVYAERVLRDRVVLRRRSRRLIGAAIAAAAIVGTLAAGIAATHGHPADRAKLAWTQFTDIDSDAVTGDTHLATLGSTRYDFWRVAVGAWLEHPVAGLGQDNFVDIYTRERRIDFEEPRWVHSLPLRLLAHTGLVGAALFLAFLGAVGVALVAVWRSGRGASAQIAAGAALLPAIVWVAHGSVDWLWEFPALSCAALGFAGAAVALARDADATQGAADSDGGGAAGGGPAPRTPPRSPRVQRAIAGGAVAIVLAGALIMVPSLISDSEVSEAALRWRADPPGALQRLDRARTLNPLAARPWLVEGQIQARRRQLAASREAFAHASAKQPDAWYPHFAHGLIASAAGDPQAAVRSLRAARERNPLEPLIGEALRRVDGAPMTLDEALRRFDQRLDERRTIEP